MAGLVVTLELDLFAAMIAPLYVQCLSGFQRWPPVICADFDT
jgi:hypothetical protein